jgi:subtilisin family serine protease
MDPALQELIAEGAPEDEVAVVVRLNPKAQPPRGLRIVARFGSIATARAARHDLHRLHADPAIASMKAPRTYGGDIETAGELEADESDPDPLPTDLRRPAGLPETGAGTVVAVLDWGCDFAHPDFRKADGSPRLIALWDQRAEGESGPYGYGRIHDRAAIDRALAAPDPFAALGYRPSQTGAPAHGTHVLGIAAGNGRAGGPAGVAPEADICFVHLGSGGEDLGSSIEILEGLHFAAKCAGSRPLAFNLSVGKIAGSHLGRSLVEGAFDWLLVNRPGTALAQSTGNYYARDTHMSGQIRERQRASLPFRVGKRDATPISVEIWYPGADELTARMRGPDGAHAAAALGADMPVLTADGRKIGHFYHRREDPNSGDNLINLFLYEAASSGDWEIGIEGVDIVDGRWHAWIERNSACPQCQSQFRPDRADRSSTTGSICNALRTIAVGAYDAHDPDHALGHFSSAGPTRDGRRKPLLVAPGVKVLSVRSRTDAGAPPAYVRMSGTSMAAPHVAGTLALMMQAAGRQRIASLRQVLFSTLQPAPNADSRWGYGKLDIAAAVAGARALAAGAAPPAREAAREIETVECAPFAVEAPQAPASRALAPPGRADIIARLLGQEAGEADPEGLLSQAIDPADPAATVIGWPQRRLAVPLEMGDLIVRQTAGGQAHAAIVEDPALLRRTDLADRGLVAEGPWPGRYVRVVESQAGPEPVAWRIAGPDGFVLPDLSILRLREPGEGVGAPPISWVAVRRGSSGPAVAAAQEWLNKIHADQLSRGESGIEKCPLKVDGKFGRLTETAVKSFQKLAFHNQPGQWDGIVGPKTWGHLEYFSGNSPPLATPPADFAEGPPTMSQGWASVVPVIVIPGILGTRLRFGGARLPDWDPNDAWSMRKWGSQDPAAKLKGFDFRAPATILDDHPDKSRQKRGWGGPAKGFYEILLEGLEKELGTVSRCATSPIRHPVWAFGYDWRQPNAGHARRLSDFIDVVLAAETGAQQVILVTHSMGGFVARAALPLIANRVRGIVHCVQPAVGAVVAARRVHTGYAFWTERKLGEFYQELGEELGLSIEQVATLLEEAEEPTEGAFAFHGLLWRVFSDKKWSRNPIYYGRLLARMPSAVELLPSDGAGLAKPDWLLPKLPPGSIHDHYATAAPADGGMILKLPNADKAELRLRLAEAKQFHAGLGYHSATGVLYSTGLKTDNAFRPAKTKDPTVIERQGDGTVPAFSGRCPDLARPVFRTAFNKVEHGGCYKNKDFLAAVIAGVDHLAQGYASLPEGQAPDRERCVITA